MMKEQRITADGDLTIGSLGARRRLSCAGYDCDLAVA
jgi:hypothetical protein